MARQLSMLNAAEFDDPRVAIHQEIASIAAGEDSPRTPYPEPHGGNSRREDLVTNPTFTPKAREHYETAHTRHYGPAEETFLPSYEVQSPQEQVNPKSVQHMAENATGLDVPPVSAYQFGADTLVMNGNHRVAAALARGQMLVPAQLRQAEEGPR